MRKNEKKQEKGITLIALIITIIVMLILVGVTLNVAVDVGLFDITKTAAKNTQIELDKEILVSAAYGEITENGYIDFTKLDANLPDGFEGSKGTYKKNDVTYRIDIYGRISSVEFGTMMESLLDNKTTYLEKASDLGQDIQADKNIGIGTDGNIINLGKWTYEVVNNETISLCSYNGQIAKGKIEGTVPQYIYIDELDKILEVNEIETKCFFGLSELVEITLPNTIASIGNLVFSNCTSLKTIVIPEGVTSIGTSIFNNCTSLETVILPKSLTEMGVAGTFQHCNSLKSIVLPEGITKIGTNAFLNCRSLTSIKIPNSVTTIQNAFVGCTSLKLIEVDNTENAITGQQPWGASNATVIWLRDS